MGWGGEGEGGFEEEGGCWAGGEGAWFEGEAAWLDGEGACCFEVELAEADGAAHVRPCDCNTTELCCCCTAPGFGEPKSEMQFRSHAGAAT